MVALKELLQYTKTLKILYVEDDEILLENTRLLLDNFFASIDTAINGELGLQRYQENYKNTDTYYDIVITDINMPVMNGIEMGRKILKVNETQPIIIASAHNESEHLFEALDLGVDGFISKPINSAQLMKLMYKVSKAVSDHKFVEEHFGQIEKLNIELEESNRKLRNKNSELEKSFRMLDSMVDKTKVIIPPKIANKDEEVGYDIYVEEQINDLIATDLYDLEEIHAEIDLVIISILKEANIIDRVIIMSLAKNFLKYSSILSFYNFFDNLSKAMLVFASTLTDNSLPEDEESTTNIFIMIESFMYVLGKWQAGLREGVQENINSLDASLISDMTTITNMWTQKEMEELADEDMDDIFDF